jgi:hypothetical protein
MSVIDQRPQNADIVVHEKGGRGPDPNDGGVRAPQMPVSLAVSPRNSYWVLRPEPTAPDIPGATMQSVVPQVIDSV